MAKCVTDHCDVWHQLWRRRRPELKCTQFDLKIKLNEFYEEGNGTLCIASSSPKNRIYCGEGNDSIDLTKTRKKHIRLICSMLSVYDNSITMAFQIVFSSSLLLLLLFAVAARTFNNLQRIRNSPELESSTTRSTNTRTHFVEYTIHNGCWMNYIKVHLVLLWYFILHSIVSVSEMDLELFTWLNGDCNERARNHSIFHFRSVAVVLPYATLERFIVHLVLN